jgi:hypothetical protein
VRTSDGIARGATIGDVVKAYGAPFRKEKHDAAFPGETRLNYRFGDQILVFRFQDGALTTLSLNAGSLPYMQ